jgi:hypothetical protein
MFLPCLPDNVKLMLAEDYSSSVTELRARADILTNSPPKPAATVAVVAEEEAVIPPAATQSNRGCRRGSFQCRSFQGGNNHYCACAVLIHNRYITTPRLLVPGSKVYTRQSYGKQK